MVKFHIFQSRKLADELSHADPSQKVQFLYFLGSEVLIAFLLWYSLLFGAYINWLFFLQAVIVFLITFFGVYEAYKANGGDEGSQFLVRAVCLLFPITVNVTIISEILSWAYTYMAPVISDPYVFAYPTRPLILIEFVWAPVVTGAIFWLLHVHIRRAAFETSPKKEFYADADEPRAG